MWRLSQKLTPCRKSSSGLRVDSSGHGLKTLGIFLGLWVALIAGMATAGGWGITTHANIPLYSDAEEARFAFGGSDAGSYLQAALGLRDFGPLGIGGNQWIYNLWPPGMVALNLIAVNVESLFSIPYLTALLLLVSFAWAALLTRLWKILESLSSGIGFVFLLVFLLSSLSSPMITVYFGYGDGLAAGLLGLAVAELWLVKHNSTRGNIKGVLYVGTLLSGAMHLRATFETLSWFLLFVPLAIYLIWTLVGLLRPSISASSSKGALLQVSLVAFVAQVLSLPWRVFAAVYIRPGDFRWSTVPDYAWPARWVPDERISQEGRFLIEGHGNFGCINDPVRCAEIQQLEEASDAPYSGVGHFTNEEFRSQLVESVLQLPGLYLSERFTIYFLGFFSKTGGGIGQLAILEGLFLLVGVILGVVFLVRNDKFNRAGAWFAFLSAGGLSGVLLLFHMETRYLMPIKLVMMTFVFLVLTEFLEMSRLRFQSPNRPSFNADRGLAPT